MISPAHPLTAQKRLSRSAAISQTLKLPIFLLSRLVKTLFWI